MTAWLHTAAMLATAAGVLSACAAYLATRQVRLSLGVLLDFLTAAGLIRLADEPSWSSIATAAAVIGLRKLIATRLGRHPLVR
ncbi:DUF1622 domain-containing protein [Streptomyces ficellus]|uniref:DUF1622 domain-containing protein n=1 Tax=Streptomyces ficellus TaxID=1977088 RepID=A0ABT7Z413_9ACTN|nr:DUF1622 domain-containing protein [Streptomyces ficellus]MDN3293997.1 DUF1622 domain-containing protein [Streptomyces ficellus]